MAKRIGCGNMSDVAFLAFATDIAIPWKNCAILYEKCAIENANSW